MGVDQPDVALVPDLVGAAHDVVDDIGVDVVEPVHRLAARTVVGGELGIVAALDLQHLLLGRVDPRDLGGFGALVGIFGHELFLRCDVERDPS